MNFSALITIENLKTFAAFFVPILVTFFTTRYTANRPKKLIIKEQQFKKVYLPLYKSICLTQNTPSTRKQLLRYDIKLQSILHDNYELVFPSLHILCFEFHQSIIHKRNDESEILKKICYQITTDYELLKRSLGYPSQNIFSTLKRMTAADKLLFICEKTFLPSMLTWTVTYFVYELHLPVSNDILAAIGILAVFCFIATVIMGFIWSILKVYQTK